MHKHTLAILLGSTITFSSAVFADGHSDVKQLQTEGKKTIMDLATTLKKELTGAMKSGGPSEAIKVCNTKAAPLTDSVSEKHNWQVGRTSLKLRNPENQADSWEKAVLEKFQQQADEGADLAKLAYSEIITDASGQKVFRMMKAIPMGDKCLSCHGSEIKPGVAKQLDALYPEDNARGFSKGDLRGAFTLKKVL
ncbi:MAG: DUF3365 domain-containing protein [Motiliproteus sp.]|nr:DUF3365 domain-containing protein [Motiliproteus sp.]MCW9053561.1 DUF3365 domain-containing protein [Motiliproteus sp.]